MCAWDGPWHHADENESSATDTALQRTIKGIRMEFPLRMLKVHLSDQKRSGHIGVCTRKGRVVPDFEGILASVGLERSSEPRHPRRGLKRSSFKFSRIETADIILTHSDRAAKILDARRLLLAYTYQTQTFTYFDEKNRKRPVRVRGFVPTTPTNAPKREEVLPIALFKKSGGFPDLAPHNTVRGHLVGLDSLGGQEDSDNLVPMYGQFNLSTYKVKFENVLKQKVQVQGVKSGELDLTIDYGRADQGDPRVPTAFTYVLKVTYNDDSTKVFSDHFDHPAPEAAYEPPVDGLRKYIKKMQAKMEKASWWVEDDVVNRQLATKHFEHGQPLILPAKDYAERPYAVLDYILYGATDFKFFALNAAPELYNGGEFNGPQIAAILAVNLAQNKGYYKSDDPHDYVYNGNASKFKNTEQVDFYYLHSHASSGKQDGVLLMGGYHQKPEIDHIILKGKHLEPGCNAYSNARVISRFLNSEDRGKYS